MFTAYVAMASGTPENPRSVLDRKMDWSVVHLWRRELADETVCAGCPKVREREEGRAFAFDDTIGHEAWNDGDRMRAVLIFDVWIPYLTEVEHAIIQTFFATADGSEHGPRMLEH